MKHIEMSICTYKGNDSFDVILRDKNSGYELTLSGEQKLDTVKQLEFLNDIAPPCVWTEYKKITPEDKKINIPESSAQFYATEAVSEIAAYLTNNCSEGADFESLLQDVMEASEGKAQSHVAKYLINKFIKRINHE